MREHRDVSVIFDLLEIGLWTFYFYYFVQPVCELSLYQFRPLQISKFRLHKNRFLIYYNDHMIYTNVINNKAKSICEKEEQTASKQEQLSLKGSKQMRHLILWK